MYSPSSSFVAIAAIIPLLCFVIFSAYDSSVGAMIVGIRVGIRVVVGLKKLRLRVVYMFSTAVRPVKCF